VKEQPAASTEEESAKAFLTQETALQPPSVGSDDEDDIIEEKEKSVVLSGIHNQSEPGTWKVVHPEEDNVDMSRLMCGATGGVVVGGQTVKATAGSEKKQVVIRKMLSRMFRGAKESMKKVSNSSISMYKSKTIGKATKSTAGASAAPNPVESVNTELCGDLRDTKQPCFHEEKEGSMDASSVKKEDKCSSEVEATDAEEKSTKDNDNGLIDILVAEKKAEVTEKAENNNIDSGNQADSEESRLRTEVSTKPELSASVAPENNKNQDGKIASPLRRSIVSFRSNTSQDEDSVRSNRSKPRVGTVSQLKEKFNKLARSPAIDRVSSSFSSRKPKIRVPAQVVRDDDPVESQRDDTETRMMDEQDTPVDLSRADSMKRTSTLEIFTTAPEYYKAYYTETRSEEEEKTPALSLLSWQEEEEIQVETVTSRCLNDGEDNSEIEMEVISSLMPRCYRSALSMTGAEAASHPVMRVGTY
jgi:hypothetical protein